MGFRLGKDCKLYRNSGSYASPSWEEVDIARDVTLNLESGEADVTTRGSAGWRENVPVLRDASVDMQMVWDPGSDHFEAFRDAFLNGTGIECLVLDGDVATSGSQGLRATMMVSSFSRSEALEEASLVDVSIKPMRSDNPPEWWETP